jgi:glycosyltransferase involved in cell wall biosynthesis
MNNNPKVTIVSCVWNLFKEKRVETFRQTMESVHNQDYSNIEHIIINNNSTDETDQLIDEYVSKGWATCHFHPVQGLWHAMNKGIEVATGDYINFMNSDDFFVSTNAVSIAVEALIKSQAEWFYADANRIFVDGRIGRWRIHDITGIFLGLCPCHQTVFIRTEIMRDEYKGFDLTLPLQCDDRMFFRLLSEKRKYTYWPKPIANFRNGGFSSHQTGFQNEYAQNFYAKFGHSWGMTFDDCLSLYHENAFEHKSVKFNKKLAKKIKNSEWRSYYLKRYKEHLSLAKQTTLYLFGFIPILKKRSEGGGGCLYLFGFIPILRKRKS